MKRPSRAIRIVKRKAEHGNPKDFDELMILPFQGRVIVKIGNKIMIDGKVLNKND